jgi:hypothetical protein
MTAGLREGLVEADGFGLRYMEAGAGPELARAATSAIGVRREKAALSSGCKAHPAIRSCRKQSEQSWR